MRKVYTLIIFFIGLVNYTDAKDVDKKTAQVVAQNFMKYGDPYFSVSIDNVYEINEDGSTVIYVVNFAGGGWAMVSATESVVPVLGFSYEGEINESSYYNDSFEYLIDNYIEQIEEAKENDVVTEEIKSKWKNVLSDENNLRLKSYTPSTYLLNTSRGHVKWSQEENNDGGCSPTYNKYCPGGDADGSDCDDKKPAGCAAVAMGQIMWYWQYPNFSEYNTYDWSIMPSELENSTSENSGDEVAKLLRDCGLAANMNYTTLFGLDFSWATTANVDDGFQDSFGYEGTEVKVRSHYPYGNVWNDLIRAEIDAERPVLIRGDKADLSGMKHHFVCDGYHSVYQDYFSFNFGWGYPGNSYNTSYHYFDDLTPGSSDYNENQQAIIGISPSVADISSVISDVSYSTVSDAKSLEAGNTISLPANGKSLNVTSSGEFNLFAGDAIVLQPGFKVQSGGSLKVKNSSHDFSDDCGVSVTAWTNYFSCADGLCFNPSNANTYEFEAYNTSGQVIYQSAGTIDGTPVVVWDGTGSTYGWYPCIITFRNNCGEILSNSYSVFSPGSKSASVETVDGSVVTGLVEELNGIVNFCVYPNPNAGSFKVFTNSPDLWDITIYDMNGSKVYNKNNLSSFNKNFNLGKLPSGLYSVKITTKEKVFSEKLIIQ